jgi:hypothetical protein
MPLTRHYDAAMDQETARAQLADVGREYATLIAAQETYEQHLADAVTAADSVGLPLWEIAELTNRHRNYVAYWTTPRRRTAPHPGAGR